MPLEQEYYAVSPFWGPKPLGRWDLTPFAPAEDLPDLQTLMDASFQSLSRLDLLQNGVFKRLCGSKETRGIWPPTNDELAGILATYQSLVQKIDESVLTSHLVATTKKGYSAEHARNKTFASLIKFYLDKNLGTVLLGYQPETLQSMTHRDQELAPWTRFIVSRQKKAAAKLLQDTLAYSDGRQLSDQAKSTHNSLMGPIPASSAYNTLMSSVTRPEKERVWFDLCNRFSQVAPEAAKIIHKAISARKKMELAMPADTEENDDDGELSESTWQAIKNTLLISSAHLTDSAKIRAKLLGIPKCARYDIGPLSDTLQIPSLTDSLSIIASEWSHIHPSLGELVNQAVREGWILAQPYSLRSPREFSTIGTPDIHPYISVFWMGNYGSFETLGHELAHAIHAQLTRDHPYLLGFGFYEVIGEAVAMFLSAVADRAVTKNLHLFQLETLMKLQTTAFGNAAYDAFENKLYELKSEPSADEMSTLFLNTVRSFISPATDPKWDRYKIEWVGLFHLVHHPHYFWKYSIASLIATRFHELYAADPHSFGENFVALLRAGKSTPLQDQLVEFLGIDLHDPQSWLHILSNLHTQIKDMSAAI